MNFKEKLEKSDLYWKEHRKELWGIHFPIWFLWMLFFIEICTDGYNFKMVLVIMFFVVSGLFFWKLLRLIGKGP